MPCIYRAKALRPEIETAIAGDHDRVDNRQAAWTAEPVKDGRQGKTWLRLTTPKAKLDSSEAMPGMA